MTEYNFPWSGDSLGKAGPYTAELFRQFVEDLLSSNAVANAGIIVGRGNGVDDPLDVQETSPASKGVRVRAGSAFVNGLYYYSNADVEVTIPNNTDGSGFDRIDLLVLRSNSTTQVATPFLIQGTAAAVPVAPSPVRSGAIYDIELAQITAQNLFVTILDADIDNSVKTTVPIWTIKNGGIGLNTVVKSDFIVAQSANAMEAVNLAALHRFIGKTSESSGVIDLDVRPHAMWASTGDLLGIGTPAIVPQLDANKYNPSGYIGTITANAFTLEAGTYLVWGQAFMDNSSPGSRQVYIWLCDTTATTTALIKSYGVTLETNSSNEVSIPPQILVSDGVQTFAWYAETSVGNLNFEAVAAGATIGSDRTRQFNFLRIQ